jgi:hypothetical protein
MTDVDLPDFGSVLTIDDSIPIEAECEGIIFDLQSSDGRDIIVEDGEVLFQQTGTIGVIGLITGTISCDSGTDIDIRHEFEIFGNIPIETTFTGDIEFNELSEIEIPIEISGEAPQTWLIGIDGPLSRVATTEITKKISPGSTIVLDIDPAGLLTPGMMVKGEVILASDSGHRYIITVELEAENSEVSTIDEYTQPAKLIPIALALATLWVVLGISSPARQVSTDEQEIPVVPLEGDDPSFMDPFS